MPRGASKILDPWFILFIQYKQEYISIYRDIEYLNNLKKKYNDAIERRIEYCKSLDYHLSQKLRIIYLGLKDIIFNVSKEEIIDSNETKYSESFHVAIKRR